MNRPLQHADSHPAAAVPADGQGGFTLVEMLVAASITLVIMGAVASLFGTFGRSASQTQKIIELTGTMRSAAWQLRKDLAGITVDPRPPLAPEANAGYLEIIEGPLSDNSAATGTSNIVADVDDILLFTTRSLGDPFSGRVGGGRLESPTAEVAWFCKNTGQTLGTQTLFNLHRRQLLVSAYPGVNFGNGDDLSMRLENGSPVPNSLGDLTKRENRFLHLGSQQPFPFTAQIPTNQTNNRFGEVLSGDRAGEDIVLRNVLAFDVRVFDPKSPNNRFAYVDLGRQPPGNPATVLTGAANPRSKLTATYDTWSTHYEFNGIDDDGDNEIDEGTNGLDDDGNGAIDDVGELETLPPYPVPLRGLEVRIRCWEPSSRQIRQITVRHTFVAH